MDYNMSDTSIWNNDNLKEKNNYRFFPSDMVLRSVFSDKYFNSKNIKNNGKVLDIGCLYANNLVPFHDRGWRLFGTEVTEESVEIAKFCCKRDNLDGVIKLGFNTHIPFEDNFFDLILSISTLHYEEAIESIDEALQEFNRVLKINGSAIVQTVAPLHDMFKNSRNLGNHLYKLNQGEDLRYNQKFIFFQDSNDFVKLARQYFSSVEVARSTETYPNHCIDVWLFKLTK